MENTKIEEKMGNGAANGTGFVPLVTVVDFHHARGPEVESWFGAEEGTDPAVDNEWPLLPFMALSDGAHASAEDFSYFTLLRPARDGLPATSLFGISCTRQMDASALINRPAEVTRSTVQKAVVIIADSPQFFGMLRERLGVVTKAWFAQREFTDVEILRRFQESLAEEKKRGELGDREEYLGMSLRELVREFKWQTLVLFKCCLLQPKVGFFGLYPGDIVLTKTQMLFFGSRCERLCMMQFSLISLIPGLIRNLQDCADPEMDNYQKNLVKPTSLKTSDRSSLLCYMGLPLQIFGKGSLFGPYTPLQQLDILADFGTKSYIVGSTNSILLQQKDRYSDILINLDELTINITSASLRSALALSVADRRWIDFITQTVNDTWDESNPSRPKTMGYVGSEEFIRLQFEEYLLSLISSVKCHNYLAAHAHNPKAQLPQVEGDPANDFGIDWIEAWTRSDNYQIWNNHTESHLFDIVEPKHPCAGGLTIDDVQRRIAEQVKEMHLDERFAVGKEVLGRNFAAGREKAKTRGSTSCETGCGEKRPCEWKRPNYLPKSAGEEKVRSPRDSLVSPRKKSFEESIFDSEAEAEGLRVRSAGTPDSGVGSPGLGSIGEGDRGGEEEEREGGLKLDQVAADGNVWGEEVSEEETEKERLEKAERVAEAVQEAVGQSIHS
ncbi:transporter Avl9 protein [Rutstroemia sp. NJR-2017a BBW]|nr:transporter Avl9 protein [Rutstroemia sp. NJR-2017a BBW]